MILLNSQLKEAITELKEIENNKIFDFDIIYNTKYTSNIKLLNQDLIIPKNEDKLIELINSRQINFKWGSEVNMLPIEHILYFAIKNNMINLTTHIINKAKEIRGIDTIIDRTHDFKFIKLALDTKDVDMIDVCLDIYQSEKIRSKIKDNISFFDKSEIIERIEKLDVYTPYIIDNFNSIFELDLF